MIKVEEINNPNSCLNKAKDGEMLFVLLARDPAFASTVRFWIQERIRLGLNAEQDVKIQEAANCAHVVATTAYIEENDT